MWPNTMRHNLGTTSEGSMRPFTYYLHLPDDPAMPALLVVVEAGTEKFITVQHAANELAFNKRQGIRREITEKGLALLKTQRHADTDN